MMHMDEGTLQAYLDDEVAARAEVDRHLAACTECAATLEELRAAAGVFAAAIGPADVRAPTRRAQEKVRARRPQPVVLPGSARPRRFLQVPLARAALLVLGLGAVASAAIPGTPVHALLTGAIRFVTGDAGRVPPPLPPAREAAPAADAASELSAALAIQPVDGRVRISLTDLAEDVEIRVRLVDADRATIQASGAAARARFRTGPGRVEVRAVRGGSVAIDLPRSAADARVEADGRLVFQKENGRLHLSEPVATGPNSEFIFRQ